MTRAECVRELQGEYQAQRVQNEQEQNERIAEAVRLDPEIERLRAENRDLALNTMRQIVALTDVAERRDCAERMRQRGLFNNSEIRRRLKAVGLPEDHLELKYRCAACQDTGYVGEAPSRFCDCFEARLSRMLHEDGTMAGMEEQCFARFDAGIFSEEDGQRKHIMGVRRACEDYADSFPNTKYKNIVLQGSVGQGKTFLLNCIYERVVSRGFPAIRITAFHMLEAMKRQHFSDSIGDKMQPLSETLGSETFMELIETPLLLIDDLGTEPKLRNITVEYLFLLLNERMARSRHTVIATNLNPVQLKERYGERVASRIADRTRGVTMQLIGKDVRLK